jgi:hypothetical protein
LVIDTGYVDYYLCSPGIQGMPYGVIDTWGSYSIVDHNLGSLMLFLYFFIFLINFKRTGYVQLIVTHVISDRFEYQ